MARIITVLTVVLLTCGAQAFAQRRQVPDTKKSVRLNADKPSVYLEFMKVGICRPSFQTTIETWSPCVPENQEVNPGPPEAAKSEPFEAVWLRVRNNSRWPINFDVLSAYVGPLVDVYKLPDGKLVTSFKDGAEIRVRYRVDAEIVWEWVEGPNGRESKLVDVKAPIVNRVPSTTSRAWLRPGRSVVFVARREHLAKHLNVYLPYKYLWDGDQNDMVSREPQHRIYFSWYELQKALGLAQGTEANTDSSTLKRVLDQQ